MGLGSVGNPNTLLWLFCDLHSYGKTLIRKGWRAGLPTKKPPIWVFCPLLKAKFPRDRELLEKCEKCSHYKGVSHSLKIGQIQQLASQQPRLREPKKAMPMKTFSKQDIQKAAQEAIKEDEKWLDEEKKLRRRETKNRA